MQTSLHWALKWFRSGSNRWPSACKADVITTTPRNRWIVYPTSQKALSILIFSNCSDRQNKASFGDCLKSWKSNLVTPTWFEHATFSSGVRRATIAPQGLKRCRGRFGTTPLEIYLTSYFLTTFKWFRPGSNRRPCACEAHVITTTLRKQMSISQLLFLPIETRFQKRFFLQTSLHWALKWFRSVSNRGPSACKADVITTTPRNWWIVYPTSQKALSILIFSNCSDRQNKASFGDCLKSWKSNLVTPTWFEHATFSSGVRRATIAPQGLKRCRGRFGTTPLEIYLTSYFLTTFKWFRPGSNRRPCACKAHVITTTLRKQMSISQLLFYLSKQDFKNDFSCKPACIEL